MGGLEAAKHSIDEGLLLADTVEKVENRTGPKISRKLVLSRPDRSNAP